MLLSVWRNTDKTSSFVLKKNIRYNENILINFGNLVIADVINELNKHKVNNPPIGSAGVSAVLMG